MISTIDQTYCNLPWKSGGRTHDGVDCAGLAWLWLHEQMGLESPAPKQDCAVTETDLQSLFKAGKWERGDAVFFRFKKDKKIFHVAIHIGEGRLLHIIQGDVSRIDNSAKLMERIGYEMIGAVSPENAEKVCAALKMKGLGSAAVVPYLIELAVSLALSFAASYLLFKNKKGLYGGAGQVTQNTPEIPLPNVLGEVTLAGNKVYAQLADTSVAPGTNSKWNEIVVMCEGPVNLWDFYANSNYQGLQINGVSWQNKKWHTGSNLYGITANPDQTETEAVLGTIDSDTDVPSVSFYDAHYDITVPVDIRASYDRDFPVYGFSNCAYLVLRANNPNVFTTPNYTCPVQGRLMRQYTSSGFTTTTISNERCGTGDGSTVRFKLANFDILSVSAVSISGAVFSNLNCTYVVSTSIFTLSNHGLLNGQQVSFSGGAVPSPLVSGTHYYVINATTNTFQVSATSGGAAISLSGSNNNMNCSSYSGGPTIAYSQIADGNQTGNVYQLNITKGFVEFLTAPAGGADIVVTYTYYPRAWSQNLADHIVYLLTEPLNGKGFDPSKINWPSAVALQSFCNVSVTYVDSLGSFTQPRYQSNYSIDERKAIQDHLQAILDAGNIMLFCSNGQFYMQARQAQSSVFSFNTSNILLDDSGSSTFQSELADRSGKPNRFHFFFQSSNSFNAETEVIVEDTNNQLQRAPRLGNGGVVEENFKYPAVTNQQQAEFLANMLLREGIDSNYIYTWKTSLKALPIQPGDLVDVTHPSIPELTKYLRVESIGQDENDFFEFSASEYTPAAYS